MNAFHQYFEAKKLSEKEIEFVRNQSREMDQAGLLSAGVLELIYKKGWLRVMEPEFCGGLAWTVPEVFALFEELAYTDGNLGWNVNLGAGANLFSGYFKPEIASEIFRNDKTWLAGSGAKTGSAIPVEGGYRVSGRWKYASGSRYATHFTANCNLLNINQDAGQTGFLSFIFPANKVTIYDTWNVSGLKATVSNEFEVSKIFVAHDHTFSLTKPSPFCTAPIFHFSFDTLAVANMVAMVTGMTMHFLELFEELMEKKRPLNSTEYLGHSFEVRNAFDHWKTTFLEGRDQFLNHIDVLWERFKLAEDMDGKAYLSLEKEGRGLVSLSRNLMRYLTPYCGMNLIYLDAPINKVWRDLTVAGQHYLLV